MKPDTQHDHAPVETDTGRRRRFRIGKRPLDAELHHIDSMVDALDDLASSTAPVRPAAIDTSTTEAARAALADLEQRMTMPSSAPLNVVGAPAEAPVSPVGPAPVGPAYAAATPPAPYVPGPTVPEESAMSVSYPAPGYADDLTARLEAALPSPSVQPVAYQPEPARPRATSPSHRSGMLVDVNRIIQTLEDEAEAARQRIDSELRNAHEEADHLVNHAQEDAERIRDHAQQQARVLLGEVEEIISEAQHTGQEILRRAEHDADSIRNQALITLEQAQDEARNIVDVARREGEAILAEQRRLATVRAQEAVREQDRLKDQIRRLEERRRQVLESLEAQITQLSQLIPNGAEGHRNVVEFPGGHAHG